MTFKAKSIEAIVRIIDEVMFHELNIDKQFENLFKTDSYISEQEKGFIVSRVNVIIRNWRYLSEIQSRSGLKTNILNEVTGISLMLDGFDLPPWKIFQSFNRKRIIQAINDLKDNNAITLSVPDWLKEELVGELGEQWISIISAFNTEAPIVLRVNTIKISRDQLQKIFLQRGIETVVHDMASDALIIVKPTNVFKFPEFKAGYFEMQDIGSQLISQFANPKLGMRIIDACAGNGGKTLHLASLMQNRGRCIAMDVSEYKLDTLKQRCKRAGVANIETKVIDTTKVIKRLHGTGDIVLLDVPCSGLGVLKRNPEIKWRLTLEKLNNLRKTQAEILDRYSLMVKVGGSIVYSTCSILPSENQKQIKDFISRKPGQFELLEEKTISPIDGFDGFYMAQIKRLI